MWKCHNGNFSLERNPCFNQLTPEIHQHSGTFGAIPDKSGRAHLSHQCMQVTKAKAGKRNYEVAPSPLCSNSSH